MIFDDLGLEVKIPIERKAYLELLELFLHMANIGTTVSELDGEFALMWDDTPENLRAIEDLIRMQKGFVRQ